MSLSLTFTPEAHVRIQKMRDHTYAIASHYGSESQEYRDATNSLLTCLVAMIGLAGHVAADDRSPVDLYCYNEYIAYGVNFHTTDGGLAGTWSVNS